MHRAHQRLTHGGRHGASVRADSSVAVSAPRVRAPNRPEPVSSSTDSGSAPAPIRTAAVSTSRLVLPVPGPAEHANDTAQPGVEHRRGVGTPGASPGDREGARIGDRRGRDHVGMTAQGSDKSTRTHLHVHRYGPPGPTRVLAIHGLTGHGRRWQTLADEHLPDVAVAAPDLIGHGRSSWSAPWTIDANVAALAALLDGTRRTCCGGWRIRSAARSH